MLTLWSFRGSASKRHLSSQGTCSVSATTPSARAKVAARLFLEIAQPLLLTRRELHFCSSSRRDVISEARHLPWTNVRRFPVARYRALQGRDCMYARSLQADRRSL